MFLILSSAFIKIIKLEHLRRLIENKIAIQNIITYMERANTQYKLNIFLGSSDDLK